MAGSEDWWKSAPVVQVAKKDWWESAPLVDDEEPAPGRVTDLAPVVAKPDFSNVTDGRDDAASIALGDDMMARMGMLPAARVSPVEQLLTPPRAPLTAGDVQREYMKLHTDRVGGFEDTALTNQEMLVRVRGEYARREGAAPDVERGDASDFLARQSMRIPEIGANLIELPHTISDAIYGERGGEGSFTRELIADLRRPGKEMDAAGFGQPGTDASEATDSVRALIGSLTGSGLDDMTDRPVFAEKPGSWQELWTVMKASPWLVTQSGIDMLFAMGAPEAYVAALTNDAATERARNDGRDVASLGDLAMGAAGAIPQVGLERFATGRLGASAPVASTTGEALGRIGREGAIQIGTENIEELADLVSRQAGTEKGISSNDVLQTMVGATLAGGPLTGVQAGREAISALRRTAPAPEPQPEVVEPAAPRPTPAPVLDTARIAEALGDLTDSPAPNADDLDAMLAKSGIAPEQLATLLGDLIEPAPSPASPAIEPSPAQAAAQSSPVRPETPPTREAAEPAAQIQTTGQPVQASAGQSAPVPAGAALQVFTGRVKSSGQYGASVGGYSEGNRRQLMVDPEGGYFWGDYKEGTKLGDRLDGEIALDGAHAGFQPAGFATGAEARQAAEATPQTKTEPGGGKPAPTNLGDAFIDEHGETVQSEGRSPEAPPSRADRDQVLSLRSEIGWSSVGGRMVRAAADESAMNEDERQGLVAAPKGGVIGRTTWIGQPSARGGESNFWRNRPTDWTPAQANAAFDAFEAGKSLTKQQKRIINYAQSVADTYVQAEAEQAAELAAYDEMAHQRALRGLREQHAVDVDTADREGALSLYDLVHRAVLAGHPIESLDQPENESDGAYAARLWALSKEPRRGTDTRATQEDPRGGDQGRAGGASPAEGLGDFALEQQPARTEARQEVTPQNLGDFALRAPEKSEAVEDDEARRTLASQQTGLFGASETRRAADEQRESQARSAPAPSVGGGLFAQRKTEAPPEESAARFKPTGADAGQFTFVSYEKRVRPEGRVDVSGRERTAWVGDWDRSETSAGSGRKVVHIYWLRDKRTGEVHPFGSETAYQALGKSSNKAVEALAQKDFNEKAPALQALASAVLRGVKRGDEFHAELDAIDNWRTSAKSQSPDSLARTIIAAADATGFTPANVSESAWLDRVRGYAGASAAPVQASGPAKGDDLLESFVGESAVGADKFSLARARDLLAAGRSADSVRRETGWFTGHDGRWRYEISDDEAAWQSAQQPDLDALARELAPNIQDEGADQFGIYAAKWVSGEGDGDWLRAFGKTKSEAFANAVRAVAKKRGLFGNSFDINSVKSPAAFKLEKVLDHPKLFAAYPQLRDYVVDFEAMIDARGAFHRDMDTIDIGIRSDKAEMLSTLLHEIQHAIQHIEGFANGGNDAARFTASVKASIAAATAEAQRDLAAWVHGNESAIIDASKAATKYRQALMWESAQRLLDYADRDAPSGVFRLIRNEAQWLYDAEFRSDPEARDFGYLYYDIPRRGPKRNAAIRNLAHGAARVLLNHLPAEVRAEFKADGRKPRLMAEQLARRARKADQALAPMRAIERGVQALTRVEEGHKYSTPYDVYRHLAGEVEARNTQARQALTDEQRRDTAPSQTQDVDSDAVIVMYGGMDIRAPQRMAQLDAPSESTDTQELSEADLTEDERAAFARQPGGREAQLRAAVDAALGPVASKVKYLPDHKSLPERLRKGVESRLRQRGGSGQTTALFDPKTGDVYLFTNANPSPERAVFNVLHEIAGHQGLRAFLGDQLNAALDLAAQNPTVMAVAEAIALERNIDASTDAGQRLAVEEALAELAAAVRTGNYDLIADRYGVDVPQGIRASVARAIENFLRRLKALFAKQGATFSDEDVRELLENAWQAAQGEASTEGDAVEQVAFHGTPHTVDRFSLQKIGTGEGAQAYGWGLYFASRKSVAEFYRDSLAGEQISLRGEKADSSSAEHLAARAIVGSMSTGKTFDEAKSEFIQSRRFNASTSRYEAAQMRRIVGTKAPGWGDLVVTEENVAYAERLATLEDERAAAAEGITEGDVEVSRGNLYRVDVPEDSDLLDWDKPLSEQPEKVQGALAAMDPDTYSPDGDDYDANETGQMIYNRLQNDARDYAITRGDNASTTMQASAAKASRDLMAFGIPGLRYLDGASRGAGEGSHNYVIWDENAISSPEGLLESVAEPIPANATGRSVIADGRLLSLIDAAKAAGLDLSALKDAHAKNSASAFVQAVDDLLAQMRPKPRITGTKNAVTDAEREAAGRHPILRDAVKSNEATVYAAMRALKDDPLAGPEAVARLSSAGAEGISLADEAVLLVYKTDLMNQREAAAKKLADPNAGAEAKESARQAWDEAEAKIAKIDEASVNAGREWGRFGQFRQRMMREDFTLAALERKERARLERPLTPDESATIAALAARIADLQSQVDMLQARVGNAESEGAYEALVKQLARPNKSRPTLESLRKAANDARARLKAAPSVPSRNSQSGAIMSPSLFADYAIIGAYHIANGAAKFADWVGAMRADLGERFDRFKAEHPNIFKAARAELDKPLKADASVAEVLEKIDPANLKPKDVRKLIEALVGEGMRGEQAVIKAAAEHLEIAEDEVRALFVQTERREPTLTEAQEELRDLKKLVRLQNEIDRLEAGEPKPPRRGAPREDSPAVAERKAELAEVRKRLKPVRDPEGRYQELRGKQIEKRIAELQDRIARGDFATKPRVPRALSEANQRAMFELDKAKEEFLRHQLLESLKARSKWGKALGFVGDSLNLSRAVMTSIDLSALFRQGGFVTFGHPVRAAKSFAETLPALFSENAERRVMNNIRQRPNADLYRRHGLALTSVGTGSLSKVEEAYASRWIDRALLVGEREGSLRHRLRLIATAPTRGSGRVYAAFLNQLRADSFDAMAATMTRTGVPTEAEAKWIAGFVNTATGRGKIPGKRDNAGEIVNMLAFAPRLVASRFSLVTGAPILAAPSGRAKRAAVAEYARFLTGTAVVMSLLAYGLDDEGDDEEFADHFTFDPRSSDFMKLRFGNTRIDPFTGLAQVSTFLAREIAGETITAAGAVKPLRPKWTLTDLRRAFGEDIPAHKLDKDGKMPYGAKDNFDVIADFARSKMSPAAGASANVLTGSDFLGRPITLAGQAGEMVIPMSFGDIADVMEDQGVPRGSAMAAVGLLGMSLQVRKPTNQEQFADFVAEGKAVQADVKDRLAAIPVEQWPSALAAMKQEYGAMMEGVELDFYKQDGKYGQAGEPKRDADGKPKLKSERISSDYREAAGAKDGEQAHHLITDRLARRHPLMAHARSIGYDLDRDSNLLAMPEEATADSIAHNTDHPDYDAEVFGALNAAEKRLKREHGSLKDAPADEVLDAIREVEDAMRDRIQRRDVPTKDGRLSVLDRRDAATA